MFYDPAAMGGSWKWNGIPDWKITCQLKQDAIKRLNQQRRKAVNKKRTRRRISLDARIDALRAEIVAITLANA